MVAFHRSAGLWWPTTQSPQWPGRFGKNSVRIRNTKSFWNYQLALGYYLKVMVFQAKQLRYICEETSVPVTLLWNICSQVWHYTCMTQDNWNRLWSQMMMMRSHCWLCDSAIQEGNTGWSLWLWRLEEYWILWFPWYILEPPSTHFQFTLRHFH